MMKLRWLYLLVWAALVSVALTGRAREVCLSGYSGFCSKGITDGAVVDFSGLSLDHDASTLTHAFPAFSQPDPLAEKYHPLSPYIFCANNPINLIDPTGESPVFNTQGVFLGNTSEGYTGDILIYLGTEKIDFSQYSYDELKDKVSDDIETYDEVRSWDAGGMSEESHSNIWTHIASQFKGQMIFDEKFSMSRVDGGEILYDTTIGTDVFWDAEHSPFMTPIIKGSGFYDYESTVENLASVILIHEWYTHGIKNNGNKMKSHRNAYKNVINDPIFWAKTTNKYKGHTVVNLLYYTIKETGRKMVDPVYTRQFRKYLKYYPKE